jgi:hypothetical protein
MKQTTARVALVRKTAAMVPALSRVAAASVAQAGSAPRAGYPAAERAAAFERRLPES